MAWQTREGRSPETALASLVLAQLQLSAGEGEAALFTLLHPIIFSGARSIEYLDLCYAMAIELAGVLEEPALAQRLQAEQAQRNLTTPSTWDPFPPPDFGSLTSLLPPS